MLQQLSCIDRYLLRKEHASGVEEGLQEGRATGLKEGRASGIAEGKMEGASEILLTQLERRFGTLPDWASVRLTQADTAVLKQWSLNLLDAQRLEDVFRE